MRLTMAITSARSVATVRPQRVGDGRTGSNMNRVYGVGSGARVDPPGEVPPRLYRWASLDTAHPVRQCPRYLSNRGSALRKPPSGRG
ncbi:hypothetical protein GCM10011588_50610 [Nocardia jinanensis]|uniref:Uncharacterized protein n=1 Tax=Nocardia jinanensis TaxID=382504 RepID=A0A917RTS8_9NOCA|nr:hypothetical protein GCM10011588_50610 [Nocardia jinanensis]